MDPLEKSFDFAADLSKQLITLATGVIALSITFAKDFVSGAPNSRALAFMAWGSLFLCIVSGIWGLMALTGSLAPLPPIPATPSSATSSPSIRDRNVVIPFVLQIVSFGLGIMLTILFGAANL